MAPVGSGNGNYFNRRLAFIKLVFLLGILLILVRLFQLQVINHNWYEALASGQHDILANLVPKRGDIYIQDKYASKGRVSAAINKEVKLLYAIPTEITNIDQTASALAPVLGMEDEELRIILDKPGDPYEPIKHYLNDQQVERVQELGLVGIKFLPESVRFYSPIPGLGQVLGFVGFVENERQGQYGIEGFWQEELAGKEGRLRAEKDVAGSLIALGKRDIIPAKDGSDLVLTIDYNIQTTACTELKRAVKQHGADSGSLVIMNPESGAVLALCNEPTFDPNYYNESEDIKVFTNPVVSHSYESGSVFKPITMAAALEHNKVTPETTYEDTGEVKISPETIRNSDGEAYGKQNMTSVLENSLNTGAIFAMRQAGADNFRQIVEAFGFGALTEIELPTEVKGSINSLYDGKEIYLATASFGQGISVTPLQLLTAYAAIANKGKLMKPYIVSEIISSDDSSELTKPQEVRTVLSSAVARTLAGMMVKVVEGSHGRRAAVPGYFVAGKTGTAQVPLTDRAGYDPNITIGTFVGFAPVDNPRFVMLVKIDNPKDVKFAESTAAPVFGRVAKFLLDYLEVPPEREL
ncbi:MAG: penicillin-binding protein 2 [Patescibacteria group bacterium]